MNAADRTRAVLVAVLATLLVTLARAQPTPPGSGGILWAGTNDDANAIDEIVRKDHSQVNYADGDHRTAMTYAAAHGACNAIRALYAHGGDLNPRTSVSVTPLHWALEYGHLDAFKLLLSLGADPEIRRTDAHDSEPSGHDWGPSAYTVLHSAMWRSSSIDYIEPLLEAGADANALTVGSHWTPLMMGAIHGTHRDVIEALLKHGAKIDDRSALGETALSYALETGNLEITKALLESGASTASDTLQEEGSTLPSIPYAADAASGGNLECLKLVICYGAAVGTPDDRNRDLAQVAIDYHHADLAAPIQEIKDKASKGYSGAHFAILYGHPEALAVLKKRGISIDQPDDDGDTPLMLAAAAGDIATCDTLIKLGADVTHRNSAGDTCLHKAAQAGSDSVASLLMAAGASPSAKDNRGDTPRSIAVDAHNALLAKVLSLQAPQESATARLKKAIESGDEATAVTIVDSDSGVISARYGKSWTAMHFAAYYGRLKVAQELAAKGASLDARTDTGWTPLMLAVQQKSDDVVKSLLKLKVDVNQKANNGRTALHVAAQEDCASCVSMLLQAGAKPSVKDSSGLTPLALAERLGNSAAAKALKAKAH